MRKWAWNIFVQNHQNSTLTASSTSSPLSLSHRHFPLTPSVQQRNLQIQRRIQQRNIFQIQHQNKSDQSSSDDGGIVGIPMSREEKFCKAEMHQENIELKLLSDQNQKLDSENPTDTLTESFGSNSDTLETNFSSNTFTKSSSKRESVYKRSSSYHGKSLKGFIKIVVFGVVFEVVISSFPLLSLYSLSCILRSRCESLLILKLSSWSCLWS